MGFVDYICKKDNIKLIRYGDIKKDLPELPLSEGGGFVLHK